MSRHLSGSARVLAAIACVVGAIGHVSSSPAYEVTVTNITRGQQFTPILVATHDSSVSLFELGSRASAEMAALAEEGNTVPLSDLLRSMPGVHDIVTGSGLLAPGGSVIFTVGMRGDLDRISVAAMLIPTNDGFFALNGARGPHGGRTLTLHAPAYDSGSEVNDELCASIPGPFFDECGGPGGGGAPSEGEEGYVHIHGGMHGIGDMSTSSRDWRNPVARIVIRVVQR